MNSDNNPNKENEFSLDSSVESHGPFFKEYYRFTVGGYEVPYIEGILDGENNWNLLLDNRFMIFVPNEQLDQWMWFLSQAMAISAGYASHGTDRRLNRHAVRLMQIGGVDSEGNIHGAEKTDWSSILDLNTLDDIDTDDGLTDTTN